MKKRQEMKLIKPYFFTAVLSVVLCALCGVLSGCGKKASPNASCKAETFPPTYEL